MNTPGTWFRFSQTPKEAFNSISREVRSLQTREVMEPQELVGFLRNLVELSDRMVRFIESEETRIARRR